MILKDDTDKAFWMTDEDRNFFYNLSDGISEDQSDFQPVGAPGKGNLLCLCQNYNIEELLQQEEKTHDEEDLLPGLENCRWITVEQDDTGEEDLFVLFRLFRASANAGFGGRNQTVLATCCFYLRSKAKVHQSSLSVTKVEYYV